VSPSEGERQRAFWESSLREQLLRLDGSLPLNPSTPEDVIWARLAVTLRGRTLYEIGPGLAALDRNLRKVAAQAFPSSWVAIRHDDGGWYSGPPPGKVAPPISPTSGGLGLLEASYGSLDLVLEGIGQVQALLTSQPATAIANAVQLTGVFAVVRVFKRMVLPWKRTQRDPLQNLSGRDLLRILKDPDVQQLLKTSHPDLEASLGDSPLIHRRPKGYITLPDGATARGERIVLTRHHSDGTTDVVEIDGPENY
jgi:hypothetical protein